MRPLRFGKVQYQLMGVLWQLERATARQITDELAKTQPIAHSTVQTLLRQMEAKGAVAHEKVERAFVFRPLLQPSQITETPLRDLLARLYQGSVVSLMAHLLKDEAVSPEELAQLRALIDKETEK